VQVQEGLIVAQNDGITLRMEVLDSGTEVATYFGSEDPISGWISRRFHVKEPTTTIRFLDRINGSASLSVRIDCFAD
jgi:hypothetical protein